MCTYGCYTDINVWPKTHACGHVCTCNLPAWVSYFFWVIGCAIRGCCIPLLCLTLPPFLGASAHVAHSLVYCCMQALITRRSEWAWSTSQDWTLLLDSDVVCACVCVCVCVCDAVLQQWPVSFPSLLRGRATQAAALTTSRPHPHSQHSTNSSRPPLRCYAKVVIWAHRVQRRNYSLPF